MSSLKLLPGFHSGSPILKMLHIIEIIVLKARSRLTIGLTFCFSLKMIPVNCLPKSTNAHLTGVQIEQKLLAKLTIYDMTHN